MKCGDFFTTKFPVRWPECFQKRVRAKATHSGPLLLTTGVFCPWQSLSGLLRLEAGAGGRRYLPSARAASGRHDDVIAPLPGWASCFPEPAASCLLILSSGVC